MAITPDPARIRPFVSAKAFESWLSKHHDTDSELYLRIYKKDSGVRSISHSEAIDVALCWGWIDGLRKAYDDASFLQRFTPRRAKSVWSQINRVRVARLIDEKRMTAHGLRHVEAAKRDGRWDAAYASPKEMTTPMDLLAAIAKEPKAQKTFDGLNKQNLFALAFRLGNIKTPKGREKKIASFVAMLKRGETPHPNVPKKTARKPKD